MTRRPSVGNKTKTLALGAALSVSLLASAAANADALRYGERSPALDAQSGLDADGPRIVGGSVGFDIGRLRLAVELRHSRDGAPGPFDSRFGFQLTYDVVRTKRSRLYGLGRLVGRARGVSLAPNSLAVENTLGAEAGVGAGAQLMSCTELFAELSAGAESFSVGTLGATGLVGLRFRDWN